ncbi:AAA family ATPase [Paenibacillus xanthanilyticus]|uniref:AAA family ATPase n=1 Tax=Paenibacillus xanthanilyticus TaxID=1783531 RepID=A0ABV8KA60_9BACL
MSTIRVELPSSEIIEGTNPIVILGANGSGKTRFGVDITRINNADRIPASRYVTVHGQIPMQSKEMVQEELRRQRHESSNNYWNPVNDITNLLSKYKAEDVESATQFRDNFINNIPATPEKTRFIRLQEFWHSIFPGRTIKLKGSHNLEVVSSLSETEEIYQTQSLSDGEKNVFYLVARVLDVDHGKVIVVDEPEIHLHPVLARKVWDELESMRPDCRFVYITHDFNFALSRTDPKFIIVNKPNDIRIVSDDRLPSDAFREILGAASFSVQATNVYFCEGDYNSDYSLYSKLFEDQGTLVVPVGSCTEVIKCVEVFNSGQIIQGMTARGIIDRDYWPEEYFSSSNLPPNIFPLKVHEFENLFILPEVFTCVCNQLGEDSPEQKYNQFVERTKEYFQRPKSKEILERARKRFEFHSVKLLNELRHHPDLDSLKENFVSALKPENWAIDPSLIFKEERERIEKSLEQAASIEDFLKFLPGKPMIQKAAEVLGMSKERYIQIVLKLATTTSTGEEIKRNIIY